MTPRPAASILVALAALSRPVLAETAAPKPAAPKTSAADAVAAVLEDDARARGPSLGVDGVFDRVRLAYEVSGRAVHGLELARLLVKANDPIRAVGVYRAVATTPLDAAPPAGEVEAIAQAKSELSNLLLAIPRVTLDVTPRSTSGLKLSIDGKPALPFVPIMVRAGQHTIDAVANGFDEKRVVATVSDRDRAHVPIRLESSDEEEEATPTAATTSQSTSTVALPLLHPARPEPVASDSSRGSPRGASQRMLGYIFIGWGAAALIGGGVATYLAHQNPGDKKDLLNTLSVVGFASGGGLVILGLTVVLTAPSGTYQSASASASASATRFIPTLATVTGAF